SNSILYASENHFYIAASESIYTVISIFTFDLEPVGCVRVCGHVLNQFSMDEYNNTFRVVTTDTARNATELNAITIFDISKNYERVGYLDQGIGLDRQIVKSVRYDKNTCYVVTYQNTDPLYEIDCSDPTKPVIVSAYKAPGYSNYLHTFVVDGKEYVLGLGFTDSLINPKISVYENTSDGTTQIGKDFILVKVLYMDEGDYVNSRLHSNMFSNHKALFFYEKEGKLYLGTKVADDAYLIFEIDVKNEDQVVSIYKEIELDKSHLSDSRAFLVKDNLYVTNEDTVKVVEFFQDLGE
ncbi:MAG: beta-propeller domain-containing protein, partial [Anaeroplasmataceae bacterium]|nr:beta-propeller domain-containing protein [Anaeroplasmataceae bacterium]